MDGLMPDPVSTDAPQWFAMRDLKRANARRRAYVDLADRGFDVFTPLKTVVAERAGRRVREERPVIYDLLFVHSTRAALDPVVESTETLQYRFVKGAPAGTVLTVRPSDMQRFITAVNAVSQPRYYSPDELTPSMIGHRIRIIGSGPLQGLEGTLLKIKGSSKKRLLVELPGLLSAAVEIAAADFVEVE